MPEHQIALAADQFAELVDGVKTFHIQRDAGYALGDILCFRETRNVLQPDTDGNTRTARRRVSHILRGTDFLPRGFALMALLDVYGPEDAVWRELHKRALPHKRRRTDLGERL
jgi:hypothetical protein